MSVPLAHFRKALIPTFNSVEVIYVADIIYLEALENYCKVHLHQGETIVSTYSFGAVLTMLEDEPFFRSHKSFAVHLPYIRRYLKTLEIVLTCGKLIPVARRRKDEFLQELQQWCSRESKCQKGKYESAYQEK